MPGIPYQAGLSSIFPAAVDTVSLRDKNVLPFLYQSQKDFSVPMNLNHEEDQKDIARFHSQCRFLPFRNEFVMREDCLDARINDFTLCRPD